MTGPARATIAPDVVVIGDCMTDVVVRRTASDDGGVAVASDTARRIRVAPGGAGVNVASWLARLGVAVGLVGRVGDDDPGRAVVATLRGRGVTASVTIDDERATGTVVALVDADGERTMLTDRGANAALDAGDLPAEWIRPAAHLHVSGYALFTPSARAAVRRAMAAAAATGMGQSVDAASWAPLRRVGAAAFLRWTAAASLCHANAAEARVLAATDDPAAAVRSLGRHYGAAVVTDGPRGAMWSDGRVVHHRAARAVEAVDTTGAGDAFVAGLIAATVAGAAPSAALDRGTETAARALRAAWAR